MSWEEKNLGITDCLWCMKSFTKKTENQRFCKVKCRSKWHNENHRQTFNLQLEYLCPHCNQSIDLKLIKENKK